MFSREFQEQLRLGKYTSWVNRLSEDSLGGLFWMVGEYGLRAFLIIEVLEKHYSQLPKPDPAFARAIAALKTIESAVLGDHISIEEAKRRIRDAVQEDENLTKN